MSVSVPLVPMYVRSSLTWGVCASPNSRTPPPSMRGTMCTMISSSRPSASTCRATSAPKMLTARPPASSSARANAVCRFETASTKTPSSSRPASRRRAHTARSEVDDLGVALQPHRRLRRSSGHRDSARPLASLAHDDIGPALDLKALRTAPYHRAWSSPARFLVNDFEGVTRKSESERRRRTWVGG
jgi:hypothetical protein